MSLLNGKGLARKLEISDSTYQRRRRLGEFKRFEVAHPIGDRRYSVVLVDRFLAGQSLVGIGAGSRERFRRAS